MLNMLKHRTDSSVRFASRSVVAASLCSVLVVAMLADRAVAGVLTIHVPGDIPTIQDAIDAAGFSGFEIIVAPGTYDESITIDNKSIHLRSSGGPEVTFITGDGTDQSIVRVTNHPVNGIPQSIIEGFTITGGDAGKSETGGGMFINNAGPTIHDCIFTDNTAFSGGAVFIDDGSATFTECRFENNTGIIGGAISAFSSAQLDVADSHFEGNTAHTGGAIAVAFSSLGMINDSTFEDNHATEIDAGATTIIGGGAVLVAGFPDLAPGQAVMTNCEFIGNTANPDDDGVGGAVAIQEGGSAFMDGSLFQQNHALRGGAVWNNQPVSFVENRAFLANSAAAAGDAAYITENGFLNISVSFFCGSQRDHIAGPHVADPETQFDDNCAFTYNVPGDFANVQDAIEAAPAGTTVILAPGTYTEPIDTAGKAVHLLSSGGPDVTTIDVTGLNTSAITIANGEGPDTIIEGFTFTGGNAQYGGGMFVSGADPTVINCHFINNTATYGGGVAVLDGGMSFSVDMFVSDNSAEQGGGVFIQNSEVNFPGDTLIQNNEAEQGGGIYVLSGQVTFPGDTLINGNVAEHAGGGILISNSEVSFPGDTLINNNTANQGGGLAVFDGGTVAFPGDTLVELNDAAEGGGIYVGPGVVNFPGDTLIKQNQATNGGGFFVHNGDVLLDGEFIVEDNTASQYGGGGVIDLETLFRCPEALFVIGNSAASGGGMAILNGEVLLDGMLVVEGNTAMAGGGMLMDSAGLMGHPSPENWTEVFIQNNNAQTGGGLAIMDGEASIGIELTIEGNFAQQVGGGIAVMDGGSVAVPNPENWIDIQGNSATGGGGLAIMDGGSIAHPHPEDWSPMFITNNTADVAGGGILIQNNGTLHMPSGFEETMFHIEGNSAQIGGGMLNAGEGLMENVSLNFNEAQFGGAVANGGDGSLSIVDSSFIGNTATGDGTVAGGDSDGPGGAIVTTDDATTEIGDTFFCQNNPENIAGPWTDLGGNVFSPPADLNCDGVVNVFDLLLLLEDWGSCADLADCPADLNDDGEVNVFDLLILLENWG
ncbi:MAG: hypothetical protein EA377_09965 [Phycisphaerales bacterium]|nr:MAG: hypothetical protein EA377_09965 [Phycisphaerales bacterium]